MPLAHVYPGRRMTSHDYLALGETVERTELVDGVVLMSPGATPLHQRLVQRMYLQLAAYGERTPGVEVFLDTDVRFDDRTVYRPDVSVYAPGRLRAIPARLTLPPDLVVEVLSEGSTTHDLVTKRAAYERFGVHVYLVVDPADGSVRVHRRTHASSYEVSTASAGLVAIDALPGFSVDIDALRAEVARATGGP